MYSCVSAFWREVSRCKGIGFRAEVAGVVREPVCFRLRACGWVCVHLVLQLHYCTRSIFHPMVWNVKRFAFGSVPASRRVQWLRSAVNGYHWEVQGLKLDCLTVSPPLVFLAAALSRFVISEECTSVTEQHRVLLRRPGLRSWTRSSAVRSMTRYSPVFFRTVWKYSTKQINSRSLPTHSTTTGSIRCCDIQPKRALSSPIQSLQPWGAFFF